MNKREKITVSIASLLAAYLLLMLLSGDLGRKLNPSSKFKSLTKTATPETRAGKTGHIIQMLQQISINNKKEIACIQKGMIEFEGNVFIPTNQLISKEEEQEQEEEYRGNNFIYTSFLDAGTKKVAVINNYNYSVGEKIYDHPFIVERIEPTFIVIKSTETKKKIKVKFKNTLVK